VLNALPKSAPPGAKTALAEIWNAEDRDHAQTAARTFADTYGAKWPKAAAKIADEFDVLLAFFDFPAEHWIHLRTTNPIESTFTITDACRRSGRWFRRSRICVPS
jgi:transposase-like protein